VRRPSRWPWSRTPDPQPVADHDHHDHRPDQPQTNPDSHCQPAPREPCASPVLGPAGRRADGGLRPHREAERRFALTQEIAPRTGPGDDVPPEGTEIDALEVLALYPELPAGDGDPEGASFQPEGGGFGQTLLRENAAANATTRTWYAMGRIRLLPAVLQSVHPRWRSPYVAVVVQLVVGVGASLILGFSYDPLTAFLLIATMITAVVVLIYIAVNLSCIVFYLRDRRSEFNPIAHLIVPVVGILFFIPGWLTAVGIPAFDFIGRLPSPLSYVGIVIGVWYVIGVAYLLYLRSNAPERIRDTGRVFVEEGSA
jgi:Amino acid permease